MTVTLQDKLYFGAFWYELDGAAPGAVIPTGGGFTNERVIRGSDGAFFAGIVEKRDATGAVTDVLLSFAGAKQGIDAVQGEAIMLGLPLNLGPLNEAALATALFQELIDDPAYAGATVHVAGHSLGAGYTQYVAAYALATLGAAQADARADFTGFGAPAWQQSAARHFGLDPLALDGHYSGYTSANDPTRINGFGPAGTDYVLPSHGPLPGLAGGLLGAVDSHAPATLAATIGLPDWMDAATRAGLMGGTGEPGANAMTVNGSAAGDTIAGLAGADIISGHGGADQLTGGGGADRFTYASVQDSRTGAFDTILDFSRAQGDRIDLSAIDARTSQWGNQAFTYVQGGLLTGAGQVTSWSDGTDTWVAASVDADPGAELVIRLAGVHALGAGDFIL